MSAPLPTAPNTPPSTQSGTGTPSTPRKPKRPPPRHQVKGGGRPKGTKNIAWDAIRLAYVQGGLNRDGKPELPSYADLAGDFKVSIGSVALMGGREDWPKLRAEHQARLGAQIEKVSIERTAEAIASVAAESALTCGVVLKQIKRLVTPEVVMPTAEDGGRSAVGAAPDGALRVPELTTEAIEKAQALSMVYRNLCVGTRQLVGGGQVTTPSAPADVERDPPMSPEAQAAADLVVKAAASVNRAPTASAGEAPPGGAED